MYRPGALFSSTQLSNHEYYRPASFLEERSFTFGPAASLPTRPTIPRGWLDLRQESSPGEDLPPLDESAGASKETRF
jgi:hypothetical protein